MGLFTWLIVGGIVGWLAGMVIKGKGFGLIGNILVGVVGAVIGGWIASAALNIHDPVSGFNFTTLVVAFLGAVVVVYVARTFRLR